MHEIVKGNLETYLEGRLPAAVERELEAHLAVCAPCRQFVADAREGSRWLKVLVTEAPPEPSPGFYLKVRQRIEAAQGFSFWGLLLPAFRQVAFAGFMLLALLGSYYASLRATEFGSTTVELKLDRPLNHEALGLLALHQHQNPKGWCPQCWREHGAPALTADKSLNRERMMAALVTSHAGD